MARLFAMQVAFSAVFVTVTSQCCGNVLRSSEAGIDFANSVVKCIMSVCWKTALVHLTNIIYYLRVSLAFVGFGSFSFFTD
jgi:hypothetical protein